MTAPRLQQRYTADQVERRVMLLAPILRQLPPITRPARRKTIKQPRLRLSWLGSTPAIAIAAGSLVFCTAGAITYSTESGRIEWRDSAAVVMAAQAKDRLIEYVASRPRAAGKEAQATARAAGKPGAVQPKPPATPPVQPSRQFAAAPIAPPRPAAPGPTPVAVATAPPAASAIRQQAPVANTTAVATQAASSAPTSGAPAVVAAAATQKAQQPASAPDGPAKKLEMVSMDRAGIARLESRAVHMKSGMTVRVGERFQSGETLLAVDPSNGQVTTDRRSLVLF